ncbi:hypothetical protein FSST1_006956 [Fusarium sambucinum]
MASRKPMPEVTTLMARQNNLEEHHPVEMAPHIKAGRPERSSQASFWLTKAALVLFIFIFASCSASLVVLHYLINAQGGLPLRFSSSEYSWTYGPTAVLVVILSLWRRIDYYYKSTQPWMELQSGPVPASKSLLLDYISPFQLESMYRAFRFGHYRVTATIFSFFLLKAIILMSTTLFVVQTSTHHGTYDITYQDTFDTAKLWTLPYRFRGLNMVPDSPVFGGGSDKFVWNYLARLNGAVKHETWKTQGGLVTQQFRPAESLLNISSLEAPVVVFVPNITCEEATLIAKPFAHFHETFEYSYKSATCSAGDDRFTNQCSSTTTEQTYCGENLWHYSFRRLNCSTGFNETVRHSFDSPESLEEYDMRHVITAAKYDTETVVTKKGSFKASKLTNYTSLICKIGYNMVSTNATYDPLTGDATISNTALKGGGTQLSNLTSPYLAEILYANIVESFSPLVVNKTVIGQTLDTSQDRSKALFQLMAVATGEKFEPSMFLNSSAFMNTSITVLGGVLNEIVRDSLLIDKTSNSTVNGSVSEPRLHTRSAAIWAMFSGFTSLAVICLLLLFTTPQKLSIRAFCGSIAGYAAILTNSPILRNLLSNSGRSSEKEMGAMLNEAQFKANTNGSGDISIEISDSDLLLSTTTSKDTSKAKAWLPLTGSLPFVIATIAFPILAIAALELLHQLSNQRQGLVDMHKNDSTDLSYVIRISSTAVVFAIATMFNSLDFTIATIAPYSALRAGRVPANRSILFHLLSVSPFSIIFKTLRAGYFGSAASNISTLLGSFLTIVVSGLWILNEDVLLLKPSSVTVNNWHASWPTNSQNDGGASSALEIVRNGGANASLGIWEDIVLPDIELSESQNPTSDNVYQSLNYTYRVGALRPFLNCTTIPKNSFTSNFNRSKEEEEYYISAHFLAPYNCGDIKVNKMANISVKANVTLSGKPDPDAAMGSTPYGWFGKYIDLDTTAGTSDAECPSIGIFFGQIGGIYPSKWNLTALACYQGIEQIPVNVTYKGNPALRQINKESPPKLELDKAWRWTNETSKSQAMGYRLHNFFRIGLDFIGGDTEENTSYDKFFDELINGGNRLNNTDLVGPKNVKRLIQAIGSNYAQYMRAVIDRNFRANTTTEARLMTAEAFPSKASPSSYRTEISGKSYEYGIRLGINPTSKLILQILLGVMAVLGLASYLLVKMDGTLPRNPCSIASTMGFLAGSQLCDPNSGIIPRGAEYMTDKELEEVFDGWVFSIGWWHTQKSSEVHTSGSESADGTGSEQEDSVESTREVSKRFGVDVGCADMSEF